MQSGKKKKKRNEAEKDGIGGRRMTDWNRGSVPSRMRAWRCRCGGVLVEGLVEGERVQSSLVEMVTEEELEPHSSIGVAPESGSGAKLEPAVIFSRVQAQVPLQVLAVGQPRCDISREPNYGGAGGPIMRCGCAVAPSLVSSQLLWGGELRGYVPLMSSEKPRTNVLVLQNITCNNMQREILVDFIKWSPIGQMTCRIGNGDAWLA